MTTFTNQLITTGGKALDATGGTLHLAAIDGNPNQCWSLIDGQNGQGQPQQMLVLAGNHSLAVDWSNASSLTVQPIEWDTQQATWFAPGPPIEFLSGWTNPVSQLQPGPDGISVFMGPMPASVNFTLQNPPSGLKGIPVAMFSPENPNATDPDKETGSWEYWGNLLQKPGPVIAMPLAVGVNPNYGGDAFGWADPGSIMVQDTNPAWMLSMGLNMPNGPTLTEASTGAMDGDWGNAIGSARFGAQFGHGTGATPWDLNGMVQARSTLYVRPGWEMTGGWYTWGAGSPGQVATWNADFKAAFRRLIGIVRNYCATPDKNGITCKVVSIFNPNGDYAVPAAINLDDFYPGDDVVDVCAIDIYDMPMWNGGYQADGVTPNLTAAQRFQQFQLPNLQAIDAYAHAHGKMVGVCEWAAGDGGGDNPTFVNGVAAWAASAQSPVAVLGYWSGGSGSGYNGNIELYPNQKAAFIANFGA